MCYAKLPTKYKRAKTFLNYMENISLASMYSTSYAMVSQCSEIIPDSICTVCFLLGRSTITVELECTSPEKH